MYKLMGSVPKIKLTDEVKSQWGCIGLCTPVWHTFFLGVASCNNQVCIYMCVGDT